ncbi:alpha/beta fold hydrolase [Zavarzinella formosa]|uniref:alpha/beta fold hydrolase n=1 Tax=Zavarzinella formosa TaxID=360055 RepID=UPI00030C4964|nr:alpha/beta hydrolase [Zavarzinella formosa]
MQKMISPLRLASAFMAMAVGAGCGKRESVPEPAAAETTGTVGGHYAQVNGIKMYYETHGGGRPLVLIHGGGSTITTTFGKILPMLAKSRLVIAVELQAHGHTADRNAPESFEQDADDVAELLNQLNIKGADILGFSNGGNTAMQIAIRHPERARKLVLASAFYKREGMVAGFWKGMENATFNDMPKVYKEAYSQINNDPAALLNMFNRDVTRMQTFKDWKQEDIKSIQAPSLVAIGDQDIIRPEHAVEMSRLLPHGRLAILPGTHGSFMGEAMSPDPDSPMPEFFVAMLNEFFFLPMPKAK